MLTVGAVPAFAAVPGAPTIVSTSAGNHQAVVAFTAPANGGSAITGYTVTSNPAGGVDSDAGSTALLHTVTGLTNGTVYTFTVTASNAQGTGAPSAASFNTTPRIYAPSTGTMNNLVVFIRFSDQPEFSQPLSYYDDLFNSASTSLKNFYLESSYNTLTVNSSFYPAPSSGSVVSYQDSHPTAYYEPYNASTNPLGYQGAQGTARETALVTNALNAVSADITAAGLNLDGDADGYIDHITFEVYSTDVNPLPVLFYSRATYDTSGAIVTNGKKVGTYTWVTSSQDHPYSASGLGAVEIHEMGHSFGYPDLRGSASWNPVGNWDVMSISASPVHSGAYEKSKFPHWIGTIPEISQYTSYTLNDITQATNNAYKVKLPNTEEFLVLEYRKATGPFESRLPGSGLCITRVNEAAGIWGNLNGPPFFLYYFRPGGNFSNDGPAANLFKCLNAESGQTQFNDYSNPPCFLSDGSPCGISITNIGSTTGSSITFSLGDPASTIVTHALTGYLAYANGSRVAGATVTLSGDAVAQTTTDYLGRYVFTVNAGGSYTITPTMANITLSPASWSYVNVTSDQAHNFAAAKITRTVSGTVTSTGVPVNGASIIIGNCPNGGNYVGSTSTDQNGNYSFILDQGSTCAAWALKTNYSFLPNIRTFTNIAQDEVQDFASNPTTVTLSGKVTSGGSALAGVTMSCPGATTTPTLTDALGNYSFSVVMGGGIGYTVTPSSGSSSFAPAQRSYNVLLGNQINQDFVVQPAGTTLLTSSVNPSLPGQSVSFTATVAGSGGTPTGTVTFNDGGSALCSSVALAGGQAVCTTSALGAGNRAIVAVYSGDGANSGSVSGTLTQLVLAAPGAPVIGSATAGDGQAQVSFAAPASNGGSAVTGYTVTSSPAGGVDTGAGTTALSHLVTGLTNGISYSFSVRATNLAGTGPASAASNTVTPSASQSISFAAPGSATYGDAPVVLAASASSALPVSFALVSGPATLNGSTLTITGAGSITVKASQGGNGSYAAASDVQQTIAVAAKPLTVTAANASRAYGAPNPAVPGFSASGLVGSDSIGSVAYAYATSASATANVGSSHSITPSAALFSSGSAANYTISYLPGTLTIAGTASQAITFTTQASASYGDAPIVLAASASSGLPVSFTLVGGPATLTGSTLTITGAGSITVKATQAGSGNYAAASDVQQTIAVAAKPLTVTAANASRAYGAPNPAVPGFSASGLVGSDSIGSVSYAYAASATPTASVGSSHGITPSAALFSSGSAANYLISYLPGTLTVTGTASQSIAFTAQASASYGDAPIALAASATSGLPVSYTLVSGPATVTGSTLTITGAGTITVKASQGGNGNYAAASDVQQTIAVAAKPLTVTAANASRAYGAPNPAVPGFSASGLVGSDSIGSVAYAYAASATPTASVGSSHAITPSAAQFSSGSAANYLISYLPGALTVTGSASQTIAFSVQAGASYGDAPIVLAASASSALPVSFTLISGPATLTGSTLTITGAGSIIVKASQAGDANYAAAPDLLRTIVVGKAQASVVLTGLSQPYSGRATSVTASTTPQGLTCVITYDGSTTAPVSAGSHAVVATIVDGNYQGSASATLEITPFVVPSGSLLGDINGDGVVDIGDALKILRIAVGLATATPQDYLKGDVAPLKAGKPFPDGVIDIADALIVLERAVGLINW